MAIVFQADNDISATSLSFAEDANVCLRSAYDECRTSRCKSINEGQLALDVETSSASHSFIISNQILVSDAKVEKSVQMLPQCVSLAKGSVVRFQKSDERRHTVWLGLAIADGK
ncbi:hypothetical protein [Sulfitobacter sp.]|uniref:hypothetical protein n=1 Tax=Sulfitobacter sp. TaxID=1903071 RepID=UPI0030022E70